MNCSGGLTFTTATANAPRHGNGSFNVTFQEILTAKKTKSRQARTWRLFDILKA
ncbi:hypothetical protein CAter10_4417 [Collimonas arenae]|nr:hypothetical protein CAter10_4417 [Collimonas arenae]